MRITFVLPCPDLSGGIRVLAIYAQRLARRGHDVLVVSTPRRPPTWIRRAKDLLRGRPLSTIRRVPSHMDDIGVQHRRLEAFRPVMDADLPDADVVVATWWETAEWVVALSQSKGAKVHFVQHDEGQFYENGPAATVARADATWRMPFGRIVVAEWLADLARQRSPEGRVWVVPNSVDMQQFCAPPRGKQSIPTVGVMYSNRRFKGCDISLAAFRLAAQEIPDLRLLAFGTDEPSPELPLPPSTRFVRCPPQQSLRELYAAADVWLVGSRSEGFGLPLLEAMACRTPVIATPTGAAPELLAGGGGRLVKMADPQAMAAAIVEICRLPEDRWRQLSQFAYDAAGSYTWDDATDLFEAALRSAGQMGDESLRRTTPIADHHA